MFLPFLTLNKKVQVESLQASMQNTFGSAEMLFYFCLFDKGW